MITLEVREALDCLLGVAVLARLLWREKVAIDQACKLQPLDVRK